MASTKKPLGLPTDDESTHVRMSFGEHLEELRRRMMWAALGGAVAMGLCLYFTWDIIAFILTPYRYALMTGGYSDVYQNTGPAELVLSYLSIGFKAGLILAAPWIIYQIWLFVAAGLYQRERRLVYKYIGPSVVLFFVGVAFFYFFVLPLTLRFFVEFSRATWLPLPAPNSFEERVLGKPPTNGIDAATLPSGKAGVPLNVPIMTSDPPTPREARRQCGTVVQPDGAPVQDPGGEPGADVHHDSAGFAVFAAAQARRLHAFCAVHGADLRHFL